MKSSLPFARVCSLSLFAAAVICLAGCATGTTVLVPVLGGREKIRVDFTSHGTGRARADGFEVLLAGFTPNPAPKTPDFNFNVSVKDAVPPKRIVVEDITEETAVLFLTDEHPAVKDGVWHGGVPAIDPHDPRIAWLYRLNNDLRIYRFTITAGDGHTVVLDQASNYPSQIKVAIRMSFGEKL